MGNHVQINYFNSTKVTVTSSNLSLVPQPLELASDPYTQESQVNFLTERKADHYTIAETCIQIWVRWLSQEELVN